MACGTPCMAGQGRSSPLPACHRWGADDAARPAIPAEMPTPPPLSRRPARTVVLLSRQSICVGRSVAVPIWSRGVLPWGDRQDRPPQPSPLPIRTTALARSAPSLGPADFFALGSSGGRFLHACP
eukprot:351737-Chlamydomonas_euryale.AAC.7